ncbi:MAG TPA: universal stress protein [Rhodopila sp.]|uniref:universal stress protein n=1 Tax=Rhodopila sp. TaxID=2480087 RepID=UPI002BA12401|nr:universal stress protein [Rhodopila sp.]HVY17034.1 universal stress protein [Rhodopila sp.]
MSLRDILVVLDGTPRDEAKLTVAFSLAQRSDAHVRGLCVLEHLLPADMAFALGGYPDIWAMPEFSRMIEAAAKTRAAEVETKFRDRLRREGANGDWELESGPLLPTVLRYARISDVVVMGQRDPDNPGPIIARTLIEDMLMASGRPVLLVPYAGSFETIGTRVLVGWSRTREASRALHDALPLIVPKASVSVLIAEADPSDVDEVPTGDVGEHLARHGFEVSAARTVLADGIGPADALLGYAAENACDLLVTGAYGHSRTREMILGGVTRDLLQHMTLPVLMAH